jgi:hypothetical protein
VKVVSKLFFMHATHSITFFLTYCNSRYNIIKQSDKAKPPARMGRKARVSVKAPDSYQQIAGCQKYSFTEEGGCVL